MSEKELIDKLICLIDDVVSLKMENERLKTELKYERELRQCQQTIKGE